MDTKLNSFKKRRRKARHSKSMSKCGKKQCHRDKESAMKVIGMMVQRRAKSGNPIVTKLQAYQCEKCYQWHVGSNKREIMWDVVEAMRIKPKPTTA